MAVVAIFEISGMTQAQYEQSVEKVKGGPGPVRDVNDWPVSGLVSHTAAPMPDGWLVVDVWESEEAFRQFGDIIVPILRELGVQEPTPKVYPVFARVTG